MAIFSRKKSDEPRRQWGADSNIDPMPQVPRIAGDWTMAVGRAAVVFTVAAWIALVVSVVNGQVIEGVAGHASLTETVGFLTAVSLLAASAIAYLFGRLGFYYRTKEGRRTPRAMLDEFYAERRPGVTALIPSYQEEPGVILMTLLSTALQEYPDLRVVLLVDDPPNPRYAGPRRLLDSAEALPAEVERLLSEPRRRFDMALERWETSADPTMPTTDAEVHALAGEYEYAGSWIRSLSDQYHVSDHNEAFFAKHVLGKLSTDLAVIGRALRTAADSEPEKIDTARMTQLYSRLAWTFRCEVSSFQRKRFASLSAEPNKAMNLNSYIGLMGGAYREVNTPAGLNLVPVPEHEADLDRAGIRVRADDRRRQRDHARVLPAARAPAGARGAPESRRRPVALQRLPRRGDAARADRRRDHRPAAHHPPGDDLQQRHLLGRRQRDPPQKRAQRHRGDRVQGPVQDLPLHLRPHGDRGHRVDDRPRRGRLDALQLQRAPRLQRDAAGLRLARDPAQPLGQRRPADPAEDVAGGARAPQARRTDLDRRAAAAAQLHGLDLLGLALRPLPDDHPVQRAPGLAADLRRRDPLLPGDGDRPQVLRLQILRRGADLRLQPAAAAGQPDGKHQLDGPGADRRQGQIHAHAEGPQPHRAGLPLRRPAVPPGRLVGLHLQGRLRTPPVVERRLRDDQRRPRHLRDRRLHRRPQLAGRHLGQRHLLALQAAGAEEDGGPRAGGDRADRRRRRQLGTGPLPRPRRPPPPLPRRPRAARAISTKPRSPCP